MAIDPDSRDPEIDRLDSLISLAEKRLKRAQEKMDAATVELSNAAASLDLAREERITYERDNPPAQAELAI